MQISSLPYLSISPASTTANHPSNSPSGISSTPSSIDTRMQAQESSGGFCSWITKFIERICHFLGLSTSQGNTPTAPTVNSAQDRITRGKDILAAHFQSDAIIRDAGQHSAIAVIMNYNGRTVVSFASANAQKHGLELIKDQLENLISLDLHVPDNAELQIDTVYFKKNSDSTFVYHCDNDRVSFLSGVPSGSGSLGTTAGSLDFATIVRNVDSWSCSQDRKEQIKLSLAGL